MQELISTVPVLPARDMDRTLGYYRRLGFELYKRFGDEYAIVVRAGCEIHFFGFRDLDPLCSAHSAYIRVHDADSLYAEFLANAIENMIPPANKPWFMRELNIVDPDGNLLRFGQKIAASATGS
jgi:catechol 2,3-dioxygenase-like lactoylglutathione lyase family enzyme